MGIVADANERIELTSEGSEGVPGVDIEIAGVLKRLLRSMLVTGGKESVDGRIVIEGSEIDDGRIVRDEGKSSSVVDGNIVAVKLSIPDTTADKLVTVAIPDTLGIDATGIVFKIGLPSGPG